MITYHHAIKEAEEKVSLSNASVSAVKLFMYELTQQNNIDLYMHYNEEADATIIDRFNTGIVRLMKDEPLAYILGYQWFYGRKFSVNRDVFIPRYETEELCAYVLKELDQYFNDVQKIDLADIATGSGAIAITISCEEPKVNCYATELSSETLKIAQKNAIDNGANIHFLQGDMLQPLIKDKILLDVLISNPPYISTSEVLESSVVDFEPNMALFGGEDGLYFYRIILENARKVLKDKALMAFEIGYQQKAALLELVNELYPNQEAKVVKDLNGKDRMLFIYLNI